MSGGGHGGGHETHGGGGVERSLFDSLKDAVVETVGMLAAATGIAFFVQIILDMFNVFSNKM